MSSVNNVLQFSITNQIFLAFYSRLITFYCFTPKKMILICQPRFPLIQLVNSNFFFPLSTNCKLNSNFLRDKLMQLFFYQQKTYIIITIITTIANHVFHFLNYPKKKNPFYYILELPIHTHTHNCHFLILICLLTSHQ